jgi:hypothetical protein
LNENFSEESKMSTGRIVGGILALVAGALLLIGIFWGMAKYSIPLDSSFVAVTLSEAALMVVGGILGLVKVKTVGGILALVGGGVSILGSILAFTGTYWDLLTLSFFFMLSPMEFTYFFALEAIIAIVGGIILLVSSKE